MVDHVGKIRRYLLTIGYRCPKEYLAKAKENSMHQSMAGPINDPAMYVIKFLRC